MNTYTVPRGTVIFAGTADHPDMLAAAKQYISDNHMTAEEVGIFKAAGQLQVIAKQTVEILL